MSGAQRSTSDEIFSRGVKPLNAFTLIASEMEDSEDAGGSGAGGIDLLARGKEIKNSGSASNVILFKKRFIIYTRLFPF